MNNLDLMDSSYNDYQLINELSKFVRSYYVKNKPVDRNYVENVVSILLRNDCIELDGKGVSFTDDMYCLGYYDGDKIYYNYMYTKDDNYNMKVSLINDHKELNYFNTMSTLIHEFTHVKQFAVANGDNNISKIYNFCLDVNESNPNFYCDSYDNLPIERYAEIRSYYISYLVMDRLGFDGLFYRKKFLSTLLNGYYLDKLFPLESFADTCDKLGYYDFRCLIPEHDMNDSLWDRLCLGGKISLEEYYYLLNIYLDMFEKDYSCNDSVKKLILDYNKE